jgi:hypothetical protein
MSMPTEQLRAAPGAGGDLLAIASRTRTRAPSQSLRGSLSFRSHSVRESESSADRGHAASRCNMQHTTCNVLAARAGAAADFVLTTDPSDASKQVHVKLCSGDVLIFGGEARLVHHGVTRILIKSIPDFLELPQPARINLTFRAI